MKSQPKRPKLTDGELLAGSMLSIDDPDGTRQAGPSEDSGRSRSCGRDFEQYSGSETDLAKYTPDRIRSTPREDLPALQHEIAIKRIRAQSSWQTAFQNYKTEFSRKTIYFHKDLNYQITAATESARMVTEVQDASSMSLALRMKKDLYLAAERHIDYVLKERHSPFSGDKSSEQDVLRRRR